MLGRRLVIACVLLAACSKHVYSGVVETVGNYPDLASARVAQSLLKDAGIDADIPDEFVSGVDWGLNSAIHGVRLQVTDEDAEAARMLLAKGKPIDGEVGDASGEASPALATCARLHVNCE